MSIVSQFFQNKRSAWRRAWALDAVMQLLFEYGVYDDSYLHLSVRTSNHDGDCIASTERVIFSHSELAGRKCEISDQALEDLKTLRSQVIDQGRRLGFSSDVWLGNNCAYLARPQYSFEDKILSVMEGQLWLPKPHTRLVSLMERIGEQSRLLW